MSRCWLFLSGKGGTGKSTLAVSLALMLSQKGYDTCCVDLNLGYRCLDLLYGLQDRVVWDVMDVMKGNCSLKDALLSHPEISRAGLLAASQSVSPEGLEKEKLIHLVGELKKRYAYVFLDAPSAADPGLLEASADEVLLNLTPDDVSLRDGERVLSLLQGRNRPLLVVNRVHPEWVRKGLFPSPQQIALNLDAPLLGFLPEDERVEEALLSHKTPAEIKGPAREALDRICRRILGENVSLKE